MDDRSYGSRKTPLRRPHEANPGSSNNISTSKNLIELLKSSNETSNRLEACVEMFDKLALNEEAGVNIVRQLHKACLVESKPGFHKNMFKFFNQILLLKQREVHYIRRTWLSLLQHDFETRGDLKATSYVRFLNSVQTLGEFYNAVLVASDPIKVLALPLVLYMQDILELCTPEGLCVLITQLAINGRLLKEQSAEEYGKLMVVIRLKLLETKHPQLLLAADITAGLFPPMESPLRDFYVEKLKTNYLRLEARILDIDFDETRDVKSETPDVPPPPFVTPAINGMPDIEMVRQKMRAKGLLPREPESSQDRKLLSIKDEEFYGVQLHLKK